jgi:hypothetical protein
MRPMPRRRDDSASERNQSAVELLDRPGRARKHSASRRSLRRLCAGIVGATVATLGLAPAASAAVTQGIAGYGYELVSPVSTGGERPFADGIADTGDKVLVGLPAGVGDIDNLMNLGSMYLSQRTPTGWVTEGLGGPPPAQWPFFFQEVDTVPNWWEMDRPTTLWTSQPATSSTGVMQQLRGSKGGPWEELSTPFATNDRDVVSTSPDLRNFLFLNKGRFPLTDGTTDDRPTPRPSLTVSVDAGDGTRDLRQVAYGDGATFLPMCDLVLGTSVNGYTRGAVERQNLTRVVFSTSGTGCTTGARQRVWVAHPFEEPRKIVDASAPACVNTTCGTNQRVTFQGGSLDTNRLYFTTTQKLLDEDTNTVADLYEYDFRRPEAERLRLASPDPVGANVLGAVKVSDDGTHIYYVARAAIPGTGAGGREPVANEPNLYLRVTDGDGENATTKFVATLTASDTFLWTSAPLNRPVQGTSDGRTLAFATTARITPDKLDGDTHSDVYHYDSETDEIQRVWTDDPAHNGAQRTAGADIYGPTQQLGRYANWQRNQIGRPYISVDGDAIALYTAEPFLAGDTNGANDFFLWRASTGQLAMIGDGKDPNGTYPSGMSADGTKLFFASLSQIVPQHTATSVGLYTYRPGGGFAVEAVPRACEGDDCQGAPSSPGAGSAIGSVDFSGRGNVPSKGRTVASVSVRKVGAVKGSATRLLVRVPAAGRVSVSGRSVRRASLAAPKAGSYSVRVALSAKARRALKAKGRLKASVKVGYRARNGRLASKSVSITFKAPAGASRKGGR